jgi:hypothetical protein
MLMQKAFSTGLDSADPTSEIAWVEENYVLTMPVLRLLMGLE